MFGISSLLGFNDKKTRTMARHILLVEGVFFSDDTRLCSSADFALLGIAWLIEQQSFLDSDDLNKDTAVN